MLISTYFRPNIHQNHPKISGVNVWLANDTSGIDHDQTECPSVSIYVNHEFGIEYHFGVQAAVGSFGVAWTCRNMDELVKYLKLELPFCFKTCDEDTHDALGSWKSKAGRGSWLTINLTSAQLVLTWLAVNYFMFFCYRVENHALALAFTFTSFGSSVLVIDCTLLFSFGDF